jgi:hypothetical protein
VTYLMKNAAGNVYAGRASGATVKEALKSRALNPMHHMRKLFGYGEGAIDQASNSYSAIRGREQMLIDYFKNIGMSGNRINGISPLNPTAASITSTP